MPRYYFDKKNNFPLYVLEQEWIDMDHKFCLEADRFASLISKPISPDDLNEAVQVFLTSWKTKEEARLMYENARKANQ